MTAVAALGNTATDANVIDFGRGGAALVLGAVMLDLGRCSCRSPSSTPASPLPREYWHSPVFRAVNRRISAVWAFAVLAMGVGHLIAGHLDPGSAPQAGSRPVDLFFNWVMPVLLVIGATNLTKSIVANASSATPAQARVTR